MAELNNTEIQSKIQIAAEDPDEKHDMKKTRNVSEWAVDRVDDSDIYFSPLQGNVVFASAIDGWV